MFALVAQAVCHRRPGKFGWPARQLDDPLHRDGSYSGRIRATCLLRMRGSRVQVDSKKATRRTDIQSVPGWSPEAQIGDGFRQDDPAEQRAVWRQALNAIANPGPDVAVPVEANTVIDANIAFTQQSFVFQNVVMADIKGIKRCRLTAAVDDIECSAIR